MTIESRPSKAPIRQHDELPTIAISMTLLNWIRSFSQTPIGEQFPLPTKGILDDEHTATIIDKDGEIKVRVNEVRGELRPGQRVILFKQGISEETSKVKSRGW